MVLPATKGSALTKVQRIQGMMDVLDSQQGENQNPKHGRFKKINDLTIILK